MVISSGGRFREALSLMEQAIEHDPDYGPALAWAAFCHMRACQDGRSEDPEADGRIGIDLARRALEATRDDPGTIVDAALALSYFASLGDPFFAAP